ncbi:hypothetical protein E4U61_007777 [Claviceps capensis]|nr:hypothetical protein E4U61_007777 [Claviceps capensis]
MQHPANGLRADDDDGYESAGLASLILPVSASIKDAWPQFDLNAGVSSLGDRPQESSEMIRLMRLVAERSTDGGD